MARRASKIETKWICSTLERNANMCVDAESEREREFAGCIVSVSSCYSEMGWGVRGGRAAFFTLITRNYKEGNNQCVPPPIPISRFDWAIWNFYFRLSLSFSIFSSSLLLLLLLHNIRYYSTVIRPPYRQRLVGYKNQFPALFKFNIDFEIGKFRKDERTGVE